MSGAPWKTWRRYRDDRDREQQPMGLDISPASQLPIGARRDTRSRKPLLARSQLFVDLLTDSLTHVRA